MAITVEQLREAIVLAVREAASHGIGAGVSREAQGGTHPSGGGGGGWRRQLDGKWFEGIPVFRGGQMEWVDWTWKVKVQVGPMSQMLLELMGGAEKNPGRSTRELLAMADPGELEGKYGEVVQASSELYSMLAKYTDGEAGVMVKGVAELDGLMAWGTLNKQYSQRTIGRMFRVQRDCMCTHNRRRI